MSRNQKKSKELVIHTDGACSGKNPGGVAAYGYLIERGGRTVREDYGILKTGKGATNNFAEYMAPIKAFQWLKTSQELYENIDEITLMSDSQLLVNQINGEWSVKSSNIVNLYEQLKDLINEFEKRSISVEFTHITRDKNGRADGLAQTAIKDHRTLQKIKKKDERKICPECRSEMVLQEGKYGKFYGCTDYPECKHTEDHDE